MSRVIVTLGLSDEIYDLARGKAESEFVSTETLDRLRLRKIGQPRTSPGRCAAR